MVDFLIPDGISNWWVQQFKILEFKIGNNDCLYSPKSWNNDWCNEIKALWLRSNGVRPIRIAELLNVNFSTLSVHWLDKITRHYKLKIPHKYDWTDLAYIDANLNRKMYFGGAPEIPDPQLEMDGELIQILQDIHDDPEPPIESNPSDDLYEEYYGDYID